MAGIAITLAGNFSKLDELKNKTQRTADSIKSAFGSNIGKAAFASLSVAAGAAFATVVAGMKSAIEAGGELSDMVARTGADGAKLFVMQRAFENAGMAASRVPDVLNKMQKALAGMNEEGGRVTDRVFRDLGLSVSQLQAMDPAAAFESISKALAAVENPAKRAALGMEIFGKSAGQLLVMMTDSKALDTAREQVGELADTLAANANQLDAVADSMGLFQVKVQQVGAEVAVALLPQLTQLSQWMNETDFSYVGGGIGILAEKMVSFGEALSVVAKFHPLMIAMQKLADITIGGVDEDDIKKAREMAETLANNDPMHGKSSTDAKPGASTTGWIEQTPEERAAIEAEAAKAAKAAEKKAEAEAKMAAEKEKSRAAAAEEYRLEKAIIDARLAGDAERLAALEREKKIREEMARLESAGFTAAEARKPAEAKVDAEAKAAEMEKRDEALGQAKEERSRQQEQLAGKVNDARSRLDALQYESSIGAISSMQRIGGGGGAVASGLDYARQAADLQREANSYLRQLIDLTRREVEV